MIDHISLRVQDLSTALAFYKAALAPIGYEVLMEFPGVVGLGAGGKPDLWIMETDQAINPTHVAFNGERDHIHAFHAAALSAGGTDNGPPGTRPDFHPHYYAAFVLDPEGNNVEIVCHYPEDLSELNATKKPAKSTTAKAKAKAKASTKAKPAPAKKTTKAKAKAKATGAAKKTVAAKAAGKPATKPATNTAAKKPPAKKHR